MAQQPAVPADAPDIDATTKAARFVRTCDRLTVPLATFLEVTGLLPTVGLEQGRRRRHEQEAHVGDSNVAWPTAEIAVMGAGRALNDIFRDEVSRSTGPAAGHRRLVVEYEAEFNDPQVAAARSHTDDVIAAPDARRRLIRALEILADKPDTDPRNRYANIPP